ncbi:uncharacterized protein LOC131887432 [Tigriopus californicus]|uniref:uncharacterized protein LOC131887432 n=1 Tax=Tigriopus californicus TaxID=6832 RepID=UPI0027DAA4A6|nr:uncharacterized protein LOC131887432 [Tigriopus californicus]
MQLMPGFNLRPPPMHQPADFALSDQCEWPDPIDPDKPDHDWFDFFGFTTTGRQHFFSELIKHISEGCHFMSSCCTLDDVTRSNSGCSKIELRLHHKYETQYKMALSKDEMEITDIQSTDQGSLPQIFVALEPPQKKQRSSRPNTATTRTTRSDTQARDSAPSTSKGKSATGKDKSSQREAPPSQSEDRDDQEDEDPSPTPPSHEDIEDLIFNNILTRHKQPDYRVRFALREHPVPDTAIRMALLTEFTAPPLTIITDGTPTNKYHGPFWNAHVLDIGNPVDTLDNVDQCISSDYIRLQSIRSKL